MTTDAFGATRNGTPVTRIRLANDRLQVDLLTLGARIQDVRIPGVPWSLTAGSDDLTAYDGGPMGYFGALVGPVAGRISGARAPLGDRRLQFTPNNGPNLLHGGDPPGGGFHEQVWDIAHSDDASVVLTMERRPEDDGFPGHRRFTATFEIQGNSLKLTLEAISSADTLLNPANHSYWTLDGPAGTNDVSLQLAAANYLPIREDVTPIAPPQSVADTVFDFRKPTRLPPPGTLDHCFCLNGEPGVLRPVAWLRGQHGVSMTLSTAEAGIVIFDGGGLDNTGFAGHDGMNYTSSTALAMEPQQWPDAPNLPGAGSIVYGPERPYCQTTEWRFET